ncbi:MAG: autotransporter-associated beta strand repeat-containing protein [Akkermansia sp.]|nr:autotransporter-associated beta strand repeat-containing protein [Akkermansia sp.]
MVTSLFRYERITTTKAKALEVRKAAEKLITRSKVDSVHNRRQAARFIQDEVVKAFKEIDSGAKDRGVKVENFTVIYKVGMPSILVEYGFYNNGVSISGNGDVLFTGNTATASSSSSYDDIYSSSSSKAYGGAICAEYSGVSITGNGDVSFTGNTAASSSPSYFAYSSGGAIYAYNEVSITGNGDVLFSGNAATFFCSSSRVSEYEPSLAEHEPPPPISSSRGGAIYAQYSGVSIIGNETVCFEKNYERENSTYRLRSIYVDGGSLNLSAKTGGHITFHDSVYGGTTALNADYTDADGVTQQAKGTIIFSGQYTKDHLDAILEANNEGRVATDTEILNSRTSTLGATTLYGGTLQVVDGAVLSTTSLSAVAGSSANVLLRDAGLKGAISFGAGTSLELQGANATTGSLTLGDAVSLTVTLDNSHLETAALTLTGSVSTGTLSLNLNVDEDRAAGMYRIFSAGSLATEAAWTSEKVSVQGSGAAAGVTFGDLMWQDGTLYYAASPVWSNHSGSGIWSSTETNWNNGSAFRAGQDVIFMDRGAGEVQLVGELAPASIHVNNTAGNDYAFTGSGKLGGNTTLTKTGAGELTIATANDYTGTTALLEGTLNVHHSTALGATATGAASLTAAAGTTLKVDNNSHLVLAGDYDLAGNVDVAAGSTLELQKDGRAAGTLSGSGTVQATDSQVTVGKISGFTGNLQVEGKGAGLSIEAGSYTGAGTLSAAGGTLTFGAKGNITLNAGGQLVLQSWDDAVAGVTANNITVGAGATLAAKAGVAALGDMPEISNHELSVALNCSRLTLEAGATLDAEGACFDLNNGMLTLAVTPDSAEKIELVLAGNAVYTGSEQVVLFLNVGKTVFAYGEAGTTSGSLKMLDAADYFTGAGINETTQLVYDQEGGTVYLQGVVTIPEPATATLSLLALAGLCARRRRK